MKVSELKDNKLDYWVARAEGLSINPEVCQPDRGVFVGHGGGDLDFFEPSEEWAQGGPILEREMIELSHDRDWREDGEFGRVWQGYHAGYGYMDGDTPLIAAMRAYVASKFGDEVDDQHTYQQEK